MVVFGACPEQIGVIPAKLRWRRVASTQIDEADAAVTKKEIVGEVGIRLDEVELEELPQNQPQEQGCRPVPLRVRVFGAAQIFEGTPCRRSIARIELVERSSWTSGTTTSGSSARSSA